MVVQDSIRSFEQFELSYRQHCAYWHKPHIRICSDSPLSELCTNQTMNAIITRISNKINPIRLVGFCGGCVVGSSSEVWQRSSPALGLQPPTPSVAQLWVALAPQFDYKTCYLSGGFVVQVWWGLPQRAQSWATSAPHFCHTLTTQCGGSVAGPDQ